MRAGLNRRPAAELRFGRRSELLFKPLRDREIKLKLYSQRGVLEYWIVSWLERRVEIYRRVETVLTLVGTLYETDTLQSPLLPGFTCLVGKLFAGLR